MQHIFIVEDDQNIRELIAYALNNNGFKASGFPDAKSLYQALEKGLPSLFILDIMLDGEDGYQILKHLKSHQETENLPVIMLTAKTSEYDKVKGLDMGADDYITKPFGVMELISRVRAVLRRYDDAKDDREQIQFEGIHLDLAKREVAVDGKPVHFTYKEFELLYYFLLNVEVVLSRDRLMSEIWGYDYRGMSRTVDVHVRSLRQKLGPYGDLIQTVRNVGYKMSRTL